MAMEIITSDGSLLDFCCYAVTWTCGLLVPYTGYLVADSHALQVREILLTYSVVISSSVLSFILVFGHWTLGVVPDITLKMFSTSSSILRFSEISSALFLRGNAVISFEAFASLSFYLQDLFPHISLLDLFPSFVLDFSRWRGAPWLSSDI